MMCVAHKYIPPQISFALFPWPTSFRMLTVCIVYTNNNRQFKWWLCSLQLVNGCRKCYHPLAVFRIFAKFLSIAIRILWMQHICFTRINHTSLTRFTKNSWKKVNENVLIANKWMNVCVCVWVCTYVQHFEIILDRKEQKPTQKPIKSYAWIK